MGKTVEVSERHESILIPYRNGDGKEDPIIINIRDFDRETRTPSLLLKVDSVFESTLEAFPDHTPLAFHWYTRSRETTKDSSSGLKGSGSNRMSDIVVVVLNDPYLSPIETNLQQGKEYTSISIKLIHWVGEEKPKIVWESAFGVVRVIHVVPGKLYTAIVFRANEYLSTRYEFAQDTGSPTGSAPVSYNYATGGDSVGVTAASQ